jgi:hypothetical protein
MVMSEVLQVVSGSLGDLESVFFSRAGKRRPHLQCKLSRHAVSGKMEASGEDIKRLQGHH